MKITKLTIALASLLIIAINAFSLKSKTKTATSNRMRVAEEYSNSLKNFNNKYWNGKINKIPNL